MPSQEPGKSTSRAYHLDPAATEPWWENEDLEEAERMLEEATDTTEFMQGVLFKMECGGYDGRRLT